MQTPEEIDKKYERRKITERENTLEKLTKLERQKQAYVLDLQGYTNKEIAEKMNVSDSTIDKDLHEIRLDAKNFFTELSKNGLIKSLVESYLQIDLVQKELWKLYRESKEDKIKVLGAIVEASSKKKELFWASGQKPSGFSWGLG